MKRFACALAFSASTVASAQHAPIEIKGVPLGLAISAYDKVFPPPGLKCYGDTCYNQAGSNLFYGGAVVTAGGAELIDGKVESIGLVIWEEKFSDVVAALAEKFGKPTNDVNVSVQNRLGNSFANRRVTWALIDGTITAEQRSGDVEHSSITLSSNIYLKSLAAKAATKPKEDAKGL